MRVRLDQIVVGDRHRKDLGDLRGLRESMDRLGLLHPIGITGERKLIFGARRLAAAGLDPAWESIEARTIELDSIVDGEADENALRKDFTESERVAIYRTVREQLGSRQGQRTDQLLGKCPEVSEEDRLSRSIAAKRVGFSSGTTAERAESVVAAGEENPERFGDLVEQMDRSGKVNGAYKALRTRQVASALIAKPPPPPQGPFDVIVIDPPWQYESRSKDPSHRSANPYPDMSIKEICELPVASRLEPDAIVWLWTTNAFLRDAFSVADAWGLQHRTMLTWVKDKFGTGDWLRGQTEHCLLLTRGKPTVTLTNQTTAISGPLREHSRKPNAFYDLVRSLCPGTRLDWFGREPRDGFKIYGAESGKFVAA